MAGPSDAGDDSRLALMAAQGNDGAFAELMHRHRSAVYRLARLHVGDEAEALDLTQEAFVAVFTALGRFDADKSFRAWILRITLNKCRDWARRRKVRRLFAFALPIEEAAHVHDPGPDPEMALQSAVEVARIQAAIQDLPANLREPLVLCAIEGMSQDEAASLLGVSRKAIETRIHRGRQKLSAMLEGRAA